MNKEEGQYVQPDFLRIQHGTDGAELWVLDGSGIDCTAVENAYADNLYECFELEYQAF